MMKTLQLASAVIWAILSVAICSPQAEMYSQSSSCAQIKLNNPTAQSGIYYITLITGTHRVYCEMGINGGGYTFISQQMIAKLTPADIKLLWKKRYDVLLRLSNPDGTQPYTVLKPRRYKFSVQINSYTGYTKPVNVPTLGPYLFLGTFPVKYAKHNAYQGFISNNKPVLYKNCGKNSSNDHFAFFSNPDEKPVSTYLKSNLIYETKYVAVNWRKTAVRPHSNRRMPLDFFMLTEMHFGGCGCYTSSDRWLLPVAKYKALGTAIGLR